MNHAHAYTNPLPKQHSVARSPLILCAQRCVKLHTPVPQWFMDNLTLQEASDLAAGKYYQNVDLNALVQFLAGMEEQKTILGVSQCVDVQRGRCTCSTALLRSAGCILGSFCVAILFFES